MTKAQKLAEKRIENAYYKTCSGVQISMLDIPKVFAVGHKAIDQGVDDDMLECIIAEFVGSIRRN